MWSVGVSQWLVHAGLHSSKSNNRPCFLISHSHSVQSFRRCCFLQDTWCMALKLWGNVGKLTHTGHLSTLTWMYLQKSKKQRMILRFADPLTNNHLETVYCPCTGWFLSTCGHTAALFLQLETRSSVSERQTHVFRNRWTDGFREGVFFPVDCHNCGSRVNQVLNCFWSRSQTLALWLKDLVRQPRVEKST